MDSGKAEAVALIELPGYCRRFLNACGDRTVVLMNGPLGAGKTQFVKTCVKFLGGQMADSPTFSIINEYDTKTLHVSHVDLYRLEDPSDIESTGFWELFENEKGLIFIEWAERIPIDQIPVYWKKISLDFDFLEKETSRKIIYKAL